MRNQPTLTLDKESFRRARLSKGLTQRELAEMSGYSERVIRKAELGGRIRYQVACDIAAALSIGGHSISVEQLRFDPIAYARCWMESFDRYGIEMIPHVQHFLHPEMVFKCAGNVNTFPFNGIWKGIDGHQGWLNAFFGIFVRVQGIEPRYLAGENIVSARWFESVYMHGVLCPPVCVCLSFHFRDGFIELIEDDYDTQAGAEYRDAVLDKLSQRSSEQNEINDNSRKEPFPSEDGPA